jgi:hypothetical protein
MFLSVVKISLFYLYLKFFTTLNLERFIQVINCCGFEYRWDHFSLWFYQEKKNVKLNIRIGGEFDMGCSPILCFGVWRDQNLILWVMPRKVPDHLSGWTGNLGRHGTLVVWFVPRC